MTRRKRTSRRPKAKKKPYPYTEHRDPITGATIRVERTADGFGPAAVWSTPDDGPLPWAVLCTTHRQYTLCSTREEARRWSRDPGHFCDKCDTLDRKRKGT